MAKSEPRLGKGLGALLGEYAEDREEPEGPVREVSLSEITPNPFQPRRGFGGEALEQLIESIRDNGLLQPLVVRPAGDGFQIVAGERRYRALKALERQRAPVVVRSLTDQQMLVMALVENLQRENLSPLEEAAGYLRLMEDFELTQREVAERVGKDRSTVSNTIRLLDLPDPVRELMDRGELSAGHGRAILGLESEEARVALAREVVEEELSVRATEERVRSLRASGEEDGRGEEEGAAGKKEGTERDRRRSSAVAKRAERALGRALGTEVRVRLDGEASGELRIRFHDSEDFERLVEIIAGDEAAGLFDGA